MLTEETAGDLLDAAKAALEVLGQRENRELLSLAKVVVGALEEIEKRTGERTLLAKGGGLYQEHVVSQLKQAIDPAERELAPDR